MMPTGIMGALQTVDVRDMLCAQALALVAQAVAKLHSGEALAVRYNTEDVRHDLLVWAREQGCGVRERGSGLIQLQHLV